MSAEEQIDFDLEAQTELCDTKIKNAVEGMLILHGRTLSPDALAVWRQRFTAELLYRLFLRHWDEIAPILNLSAEKPATKAVHPNATYIS